MGKGLGEEAEVLADLRERDSAGPRAGTAPLRAAEDAIVLDTTTMRIARRAAAVARWRRSVSP